MLSEVETSLDLYLTYGVMLPPELLAALLKNSISCKSFLFDPFSCRKIPGSSPPTCMVLPPRPTAQSLLPAELNIYRTDHGPWRRRTDEQCWMYWYNCLRSNLWGSIIQIINNRTHIISKNCLGRNARVVLLSVCYSRNARSFLDSVVASRLSLAWSGRHGGQPEPPGRVPHAGPQDPGHGGRLKVLNQQSGSPNTLNKQHHQLVTLSVKYCIQISDFVSLRRYFSESTFLVDDWSVPSCQKIFYILLCLIQMFYNVNVFIGFAFTLLELWENTQEDSLTTHRMNTHKHINTYACKHTCM